MAVNYYRFDLLERDQCFPKLDQNQLLTLLKAWRKYHGFDKECTICKKRVQYETGYNFTICCNQLYQENSAKPFRIRYLAISTPGYNFVLPQLQRMITKNKSKTNQNFLIIPDPVFWQMDTTLTYEKVMKFVSGKPVTRRTEIIQPPNKAPVFYKQLQETPLNYGSINSRSCGKATLIRQVAFGKRCIYSMRGMIVPDSTLRPNEIRLPNFIIEKFGLKGKWILLNRMPTLQPENFVALQVPLTGWSNDCFGVPLEILSSINGDFDGDEANIYMIFTCFSQAECATLLNPEWEMGSFVMGLKLHPSQDMLVAYYLFYDEIDFLPYKNRNLNKTFRVIYELYGSKVAFKAFDKMRLFYLDKLENEICFALTLEEINWIVKTIKVNGDLSKGKGCLITQVLAGAKGSFEHLRQMFGQIGMQGDVFVKNSFWSGLTPCEAMAHAKTSHEALSQTLKIWQPGYGHNKIMFNVQGMTVDYLGRLMDGKHRVLEKDILNVVHYTDVMSEDTFDFLLNEVLVKKCFQYCN